MNSKPATVKEEVQKIHKQSVVIDALGGYGFLYSDILAGGINATHVSLALHPYQKMDYVFDQVKRYYSLIEMVPESLTLVQEVEDIKKAKERGKLGIIFGFQNAVPLGEDVALLPIFHKLGVRIIQLTYSEANALGCGCLEPTDTGLTSLGIQVIQAMNRLGILVDLSHTGYRTSKEAIEVSLDPVSFTHANPLALKKSPRNRPDELIRMVADKGGVIGLVPYGSFCKSEPGKRPTLNDFLDQIDYVVELVGIDHVGIGTDKFEGRTKEEYFLEFQSRYPILVSKFEERHVEGFSHISHFPRITEGLLSRGYSAEDCGKIIGGNFYSLFQRVWKTPSF
jgi:membrane dipeptidase